LQTLLMLRKEKAYGKQTDFWIDANCIGWERAGDAGMPGSGLVVLLSNATESVSRQLQLSQRFAGKRLSNVFGNLANEVRIDAAGNGVFELGTAKAGVWIIT
jgi:alpha-amylase